MPRVLTTRSSVGCAHKGTVGVSGRARLVVDGGRALYRDAVLAKAVTGCVIKDDKQSDTKACDTVTQVSAGEAGKLTVDGTPVLTTDLAGQTSGKVSGVQQPLGPATAGQSRLHTT